MAEHHDEPGNTLPHRLPTLSAADALREENQTHEQTISLGLDALDALLQSHDPDYSNSGRTKNGLVRGQIVEMFGPPGVGKTTFCAQLAAAALHSGGKVLWIDTTTQLVGGRLQQILSNYIKAHSVASSAEGLKHSVEQGLSRLSHCVAPTFAHLLALLSYPKPSFPAIGTILIVVDTISAALDSAYPRHTDARYNSNQNNHSKWLADRRPAAAAEIGTKLAKLAASKNVSVVLTSTTTTKIRIGSPALLRSAVSGYEWETSITIRLAMYQDWLNHHRKDPKTIEHSARFVELVGTTCSSQSQSPRRIVPFRIDEAGIHEICDIDIVSSTHHSKIRKNAQTKKRPYDEIADPYNQGDSSSDYGWEDEDQLAAKDSVETLFL